MATAHLMQFMTADGAETLDKTGGVPSHLPSSFPVCEDTGEEMAFLAQFYCRKGRLELPGILCLQLYQCPEEDDNPLPEVVLVPDGAKLNHTGLGVASKRVAQYKISWETVEERQGPPVIRTYSLDEHRFGDSKIGGYTLYAHVIPDGSDFLLQLREEPANFRFVSYALVLCRDMNGQVIPKLA